MPLCGECVNKRPGQPATVDPMTSEKVCKDVETSDAPKTAPAEVPEVQPVEGEQAIVDVEGIVTEEEAERVLPKVSRTTSVALTAAAKALGVVRRAVDSKEN